MAADLAGFNGDPLGFSAPARNVAALSSTSLTFYARTFDLPACYSVTRSGVLAFFHASASIKVFRHVYIQGSRK